MMRCSSLCSKKAVFFGRFAGGLCEEHAVKLAAEYSVDMFHSEFQDALKVLVSETLGGRLYAYEDPADNKRQHGYWAKVEERMIRQQLAEENILPGTDGFWTAAAQRVEENHRGDPSPWADHIGLSRFGGIRQQADGERQRAREKAVDEAISALREIAAGHNDPRTLALAVLSRMDGER